MGMKQGKTGNWYLVQESFASSNDKYPYYQRWKDEYENETKIYWNTKKIKDVKIISFCDEFGLIWEYFTDYNEYKWLRIWKSERIFKILIGNERNQINRNISS